MGLRVELDWFDKEIECCVGQEYSIGVGEDRAVIGLANKQTLLISSGVLSHDIYNGFSER